MYSSEQDRKIQSLLEGKSYLSSFDDTFEINKKENMEKDEEKRRITRSLSRSASSNMQEKSSGNSAKNVKNGAKTENHSQIIQNIIFILLMLLISVILIMGGVYSIVHIFNAISDKLTLYAETLTEKFALYGDHAIHNIHQIQESIKKVIGGNEMSDLFFLKLQENIEKIPTEN